MDAVVFQTTIVKPVLVALGNWTQASEMLLMGTAAQESGLRLTHQINGPALGYFQMEPATYADCWTNFLDFRPGLKAKVLALRTTPGPPKAADMVTDPKFAAAMARVRYMRVPASILASPHDIAAYWKLYYNTPLGAGTVSEFIASWNKLLTPRPYARIA
jgi:hypothetical protein